LEARWPLDETAGRVAFDSSGHHLDARSSADPKRLTGTGGNFVVFDGQKEYIETRRSAAFRLGGSMTITAWINSSSFPVDDAAIVSELDDQSGYQLDTTIDKGPRTVGFKLSTTCGSVMARYGATPLAAGVWYHVAGVYDAPRRSLDVYLDGHLDNGALRGTVRSSQHSSRLPVYIGRRPDLGKFGFLGMIRDVRIYSFALSSDQIDAVMRGDSVDSVAASHLPENESHSVAASAAGEDDRECAGISEDGDQWIPLKAAILGVLVAVVSIGVCPSSVVSLACSLVAGLLLLPLIYTNVPSFNLWLVPLVALAGGLSVAFSVRRETAFLN
jgi:hypothetical protein